MRDGASTSRDRVPDSPGQVEQTPAKRRSSPLRQSEKATPAKSILKSPERSSSPLRQSQGNVRFDASQPRRTLEFSSSTTGAAPDSSTAGAASDLVILLKQ